MYGANIVYILYIYIYILYIYMVQMLYIYIIYSASELRFRAPRWDSNLGRSVGRLASCPFGQQDIKCDVTRRAGLTPRGGRRFGMPFYRLYIQNPFKRMRMRIRPRKYILILFALINTCKLYIKKNVVGPSSEIYINSLRID